MSTEDIPQLNPIAGLVRRFAAASLPGVTEPQLTYDVTIPQAPENAPVRTLLQHPNQRRYQQIRANIRRRERQLPELEITAVEFNLYSTEEIDRYAGNIIINNPEERGPGTVRDTRMGPLDDTIFCDTCSRDIRGCPGHIGKIMLPKLMHPLAIDSIKMVLSCVCNSCSKLLVTREELEQEGITRMIGYKRLQAIKDLAKNKQCQQFVDDPLVQRCGVNPVYTKIKDLKDDYHLPYTWPGAKGQDKIVRLKTPDEVYDILNPISDEDAQLLGFTQGSHPRDMIIERMIVIPYCSRPDLYQGEKFFPDDLTTMYIDIVKKVREYTDPNIGEAKKTKCLQEIFYRVSHFMKNDGHYKQGNVKVYTDVKKRIQGKTAIIRGHLMGKRVNFAGRTIIGPGAYLRVDEVGIPRQMAVKLTRPIRVLEMNRAELQAKYDNGKVTHITPATGQWAGSRVMIHDQWRQNNPNLRLQIGDIVERILEDGDIVLINRQPTLHKQNILAVHARIIDDRIIRINLSVTTPLNADFDGDEINIHVPQTIEAYAEAEQLLGVYQNLMSGQTNKPMMGIVYDSLTGAYLLTYYEEEVDRLTEEIEKLAQEMAKLDPQTEKYQELEASQSRQIARLQVVREKILLDPIVFDQALMQVADEPQYDTLPARLQYYGIPWYSGRALFSASLPEDFDYNYRGVIIKNGVLLRGTLGKDTLGNKDGSIIAEMYKQMGGLVTVDFMSDVQFILREFLQARGFSVGLDDCIPNDPNFRRMIEEQIADATMKVLQLTSKSTNEIIAEQKERKIGGLLDLAKSMSDKVAQEYFDPENALVIMANSGAKGSTLNITQMSSLLGQQRVSGKRIPANLIGNRALPVFEPGDPDPRARGFCYNSFSTGLEPSEFFFHMQGGRENLTDTAINTAQTGFLQHQIIKSAEDVHIAPDGSVRSGDNGIVQFVYGDDGMDASELGSVKIRGESVPFFRNLYQLADKINRKYGST